MNDRVEKLESDLADVRKDFAEINRTLKGIASERAEQFEGRARRAYHKAANRAQNVWDDVTDAGEEYYERARARMDDGLDNLNNCVREKPLQSLAIVAGIGFMLGFLTRR